MRSEPRIAFVTDALPFLGGAEKVVFAALEAFPGADLFALIYNQEAFRNTPLAHRSIRTSFLNSIPLAHRWHRLFLPLMPAAIERFDLRAYDTVVSFNYAVANGARARARHLSYTYTPMRYAWQSPRFAGQRGAGLQPLLQPFRSWDRRAALRVDEFAAISGTIQKRIQLAYGREARLIYPPVELDRFSPAQERGDHFVTLSRLVSHKRIDLIVEAFSHLKLPLIVIGEGPDRPRLQRLSAANIRFVGYQSDEEVAELLGSARGFVCAAEEDFGIAIVEAQAAGCPVIAYRGGGALETVREWRTGLFFDEATADSLIEAVQRFERSHRDFHTEELLGQARRFSKQKFKQEFTAFVQGAFQPEVAPRSRAVGSQGDLNAGI